MCGIVGHIGNNTSSKNALEGLRLLEYRGYDSAGLAFIDKNHKLNIIKKEGRVGALIEETNKTEVLGTVAISHTRWATHGKPSDVNAHPHVAGDIALVHNGIIENFSELRDYVKQLGCTIVSETDTEVIAHLVSMETGTLYERVNKTLGMLKGSYALAVVSEKEPDCIVVAKNHSPMVVGLHNRGAVVASDIQALLPFTNKVAIMLDGEIAIIKKDKIEFFFDGKKITKEYKNIPWTLALSNLGKFDTYMIKEISEQPMVIFDTMLKNNWSNGHNQINEIFSNNEINDIVFVACGTSYHACMIGANLIERLATIRASVKLASEFKSNNYMVGPKTLVVAVSQSGETADTLTAIKDAKSRGAKILSIVNVMGSSIEREADYVLYTAAGPEISVASTKAFIAQLTVLYMLAATLRNLKTPFNVVKDNMIHYMVSEMGVLPNHIGKTLELESQIKELSSKISKKKSVLYIGRGLGFPIALEGALKLKEISYIHAEGISAGELKHGTIALIEKGTPVIVLATKGLEYDKIMSNIQEVRTRGAFVISIATEGDEKIMDVSDEVIYVPKVDDIFDPIVSVIPLQLIAYHTAKELGRDIDKPRNLAKSVTVE